MSDSSHKDDKDDNREATNVHTLEDNDQSLQEKEALALIEGERIIPLSEQRKTTKKWEVIAY